MYRSLYVEPPLTVASFAEAWIEILCLNSTLPGSQVASFAEAWIEIETRFVVTLSIASPPSRRLGLKL